MATKIDAGNNVTRRDMFLIPPDKIIVDRLWNCRGVYGHSADHIQGLADSIKAEGQKQPCGVKIMPDKRVKLVSGYGRWEAVSHLQKHDPECGDIRLACVVTRLNDKEAFRANVIENVQRANLSPVQEALAMRRLEQEHGMKQMEIARLWPGEGGKHRTPAFVSNRLKLLNLCDEARELCHKGTIGINYASALADLSEAQQKDQLKKFVAGEEEPQLNPVSEKTEETSEGDEKSDDPQAVTAHNERREETPVESARRAAGKRNKRTMKVWLEDLESLHKTADDFNFIEIKNLLWEMIEHIHDRGNYDRMNDAMLEIARQLGYAIEDVG